MIRAAVRNHLLKLALVLHLLPLGSLTAQPRRLTGIERRSHAVALVAETSSGRIIAAAGYDRSASMRRQAGSLYKLPIAIALLRSGRFDAGTPYVCRGRATLQGETRNCWISNGHGRLRFVEALAESCNLYFRSVASVVSRADILKAARDLGLYSAPDIPEDPDATLGNDILLEGTEGYTPMQVMRAALALATRGRLGGSSGARDLGSGRYTPLYRGLRLAVTQGTARGAWSRRISISGKTGTAPMIPGGNRTVGWFIGFAPAERPRFAVVITIDNGTGSEAAVLARQALEELL